MEEEKEKKRRKAREKNREKEAPEGYYTTMPKIGTKGPSRLMREISKGMTYFVVIVAGLLVYFALLRFPDISGVIAKIVNILKPILYGMLIAFIFNPIIKWTDRRLLPFLRPRVKSEKRAASLSRTAGILLSLIVLAAMISVIFNMLIPELYKSIRNLAFTLPRQINILMRQFNQIGVGTEESNLGAMTRTLLEQVTGNLQDWMNNNMMKRVNDIMTTLTSGLIDFVGEILNAFVGLIISIYLLYSKETFGRQAKKLTYALLNPEHANFVLHVTQKANEIFGGFMLGEIIDSILVGVCCFVGCSILKMPYVMLVSVIVGVTNLIPFFGPYIGAIPSALLIFLADPIKSLYFLIFILILQQIDGNFIAPKVLGYSMGLSSFWVIFSILLGGGLFGFFGMLLGAPTFALIYYIVSFLIRDRLHKKNLPEDTEFYDEYSFVDENGKYMMSKETLEKKQKEARARSEAKSESESEKEE